MRNNDGISRQYIISEKFRLHIYIYQAHFQNFAVLIDIYKNEFSINIVRH